MAARDGGGIAGVSRAFRVVRMPGADEVRGLTGIPDETFGETVAESKARPQSGSQQPGHLTAVGPGLPPSLSAVWLRRWAGVVPDLPE